MDFDRELELIDENSTFVIKTRIADRRRKHRRGRRK